MVLEGGLNKRIFKALSNYMLVWGERHLKECLFVSVNSLKSSLKNGINIKSKALTVFFFFLLIFLGIQGMRSECC